MRTIKTNKTIFTLCVTTPLAACTDNIVGSWDGKTHELNGETVELPHEYCVEYYDSSYESYVETCFDMDFSMTIGSDLTGSFTSKGTAGENTFEIEVTKEESYIININGTPVLTCSLTEDLLTCTNGTGQKSEFVKD